MKGDAIIFGAQCVCGERVTCIQTGVANFVVGDHVTSVVRDKSGDELADLERAREHLDREIEKLREM